MAVISKPSYHIADPYLPCSVLHPWTDSCIANAFSMWRRSVKGTAKFFLLIYLLQFLLKQRTLSPEVLTQTAFSFSRSCMFGGVCAGLGCANICFFRWVTGRMSPLTIGLFPGMIGGIGVFFEDPSRRGVNTTMMLALIADLCLRICDGSGIIHLSLPLEFLIFSVCSCGLLYCLRAMPDSNSLLWPLIPHRLPSDPKDRKHCQHKGPCLESTKMTAKKYFLYGLALQVLKVAALNFKKILSDPISLIRDFISLKNLRLPLFAGLYFSLFKGVSCLLVHRTGEDAAWHTIPAGAVASLSYFVQPNPSLGLLAFSNLSQILCSKFRDSVGLPAWPWREFCFMWCMGMMFHTRAVYPQYFPKYMFTIMDTATNGSTPIIYELVEKYLIIRD